VGENGLPESELLLDSLRSLRVKAVTMTNSTPRQERQGRQEEDDNCPVAHA